ncbi:MAG: helix-hairpin-helix domain-containing protein [Victivallaceae bacterium]
MIDSKNFQADKLNEQELVELIDYHNRCYWEKGEPEISDERYDELIRALEKINPDHVLVSAVNAPLVESSGKVTHSKPMLSLNKAYSLEEVIDWAAKYIRTPDEIFLLQPKYDGISANYTNNILATRGDGEVGENISDKLPLLELETSGYQGPVDRPVRGEIVIRDDDFKNLYSRIVRKGGGAYKNSRNAVAGIMGLKDISDMLAQKAKLTLVDYDMFSYQVKYSELTTKWAQILEEIEQLPYPMDGIVIKLKDIAYCDSLGATAHHPRGQIAFKFSGIRRESTLLNVEWSFGKNCLTPVATVEPVEIGGVTITHATLHNAQNIIDKDIHIGDRIIIERAGDVIPYIVSALPGENRRSALIENCPCCNTVLERRGPELCCHAPDCFETKLQRLCAAVRNIGIERLGEPNIRRMMQKLNVKSLKDIFNLDLNSIMQLEGFKDKSANNLLNEIANARNVSDYQVLAALNIPNIGPNIAKMILAVYSLSELRSLSVEELSAINGIGPERAEALRRELTSQSEFLDELLAALNVTPTKGQSNTVLPTICFTGKMPEKRSYYENIARERGFEPVDAVTKELSLLVAADTAATGGKLDKARKENIKIISLNDWLNSSVAIQATPAAEPAKEYDLFGFDQPATVVAPPESTPPKITAEPEDLFSFAAKNNNK